MCTIVALVGVRADYPVVLATNRDEFYARKTSGPTRLLEAPRTVGGRDLEAQGTWMGVTREGLFVGVTNQRTFSLPDKSKRSRGEVVLRALGLGRTEEVRSFVRSLDGRDYNAFNLMWGDARGLYAAYAREQRKEIEIEPVPPGIHVLPNDRLDSADFVKVERARALAAPLVSLDFPALVRGLESLLSDRELPDLARIPEPPPNALFDRATIRHLAALCVRTPVYGTRSSTIVALASSGVEHYSYADGAPDQTPFVDVMPLYGS